MEEGEDYLQEEDPWNYRGVLRLVRDIILTILCTQGVITHKDKTEVILLLLFFFLLLPKNSHTCFPEAFELIRIIMERLADEVIVIK